jgi:hypothetical protein
MCAPQPCYASAVWRRPLSPPRERDGLSAGLRIACVSGHSRWWRKQRLVAKYFQMRLAGVIYPDVYCLALMLADKFDFLLEGEKVAPGQYDLILAELQASDSQLGYLESLVDAAAPPVAVIPGPPAILSRDLTDAKLRRVKRILSAARHVWAYAPELKTFCDGLIGRQRATIIPWPYDLAATQRLAQSSSPKPEAHRILVQVPMSFHDIVQNHPFVIKGVLLDLWQELPAALRQRLTFHTFIYNSEDRARYQASGFADGCPSCSSASSAIAPLSASSPAATASSISPRAAFWDESRFSPPRSAVPEFSATTASSTRASIPARRSPCSTPFVCAICCAPCSPLSTPASPTSGSCPRYLRSRRHRKLPESANQARLREILLRRPAASGLNRERTFQNEGNQHSQNGLAQTGRQPSMLLEYCPGFRP